MENNYIQLTLESALGVAEATAWRYISRPTLID